VSFVTCELLINTGKGKGHYEARNFNAEIPFKVQGQVEPKGENYSVRDYLTELKKTNENVEFRYAWWWQKNSQFAIWIGGSLVLIGGIWPSMVSLMIGAGLGRPKKSKEEKEYDLDRFGKYKEPSKPAIAVKAGMSAAESRRLEEMQDKMEADLAAAGMQMTSANGEAASAAGSSATGVKKLTGAAVEVAPAIKPEDTEPREYTGEFYPVVKAHHAEEPKETKH
jgi:hypothetical protein